MINELGDKRNFLRLGNFVIPKADCDLPPYFKNKNK